MKKAFAILLAVALIFALSIPAFAAEEHTITIENPAAGETYTAYKLLSATYDDEAVTDDTLAATSAISYYYSGAATDPLYVILAKYFQFDAFVGGKAYVKVVDANGTKINYSTVDVAAMAKEINDAVAAGTVTLTSAGSGNPTITVAEKGYYFVDTSLGSFCSIDTAAAVTIYEKNTVPTITKEVQEDTNSTWYTATAAEGLTVGVATAALDDTVNYRLTVNTGDNDHATANGVDAVYTIVDELPAAMTYVAGSAATTTSGVTVSATNAVFDAATNKLTITLAAAEVARLGKDADIVITYQATFTDDAAANTPYTNTATLTYKAQTSTSTATVKAYEFDIAKVNDKDAPLAGVKFTVQRAADSKYLQTDGTWGTTAAELETDASGKILVTGIDDDTYTVTETETLPGYNKADAPFTVTVALDGTVTGEGVSNTTLTVVNYSGTVLPSTGGIGTTIFYIVGGLLVVAAGVLLITKSRMRKEH